MLGVGATMTEGVSVTLALCTGPLSTPECEGDDCREALWLFLESRRDSLGIVARWQNLIPSFPWIAPGWRAWGAIQGKEGIKFCSVA